LRACGTSLEAGVHPCEREEANLAVPQSSGQKTTSEPAPSPSGDFGANEWLVDEMYERYQRDAASVDTAWIPSSDEFLCWISRVGNGYQARP